MLKPHSMSSVIITGPNNMQENVIKELHDMKILHIVEHSKSELADIGKPLDNAARLSDILVRIRALMSALGINKEETKFELKKGILEIESTAKKLNEESGLNMEELKKADEQLAKNNAIKQDLEILKGIKLSLEDLTSYKALAYFTGYIKNKDRIEELKKEVSGITSKFMLFESDAKKKCLIALFADIKHKEQINNILQKFSFSPVNFLNIAGLKGSAAANLKKINDEIGKLQHKKEGVRKNIEKLAKEYKGFLTASDQFLAEQLEKSEAPLKFASTPSSFLIKGWIPDNELHKSIDRINKAAKNKVYFHFEPAKKHDKVPVKLKNPKIVKPFEFFMDLYSIPSYKEIDPTFFIFLTFPIFFGIMLGDVGYGAISLVLFWILKRRMPKAKGFFNILMLASFVTILFGLLFGEFFGKEFIHPIVSREHDINTLMILSVLIGLIHVNIGIIIGFINEMRSHGLKHAIYAKASWVVLELGIAITMLSILGKLSLSLGISYLVLPYFGKIALTTIFGIIIITISMIMILLGEGIKGLIEVPSLLTNVLSYIRLMAIGFSSVILALIINDLAKEFFHTGGLFILVGIIILVLGHALNITLGLLGSFLHSLRLHYVEFFSKFFYGGAQKYKPFGVKDQ